MKNSIPSDINKISFVRLIPLLPLPFLLFHLFLFSLWYYWNIAIEIPIFIVAPTILIIFFRMFFYFPQQMLSIITRRKPTDQPTKNVFSLRGFFELISWYAVTALGYWHLKAQFMFPSSMTDKDTYTALALGYAGYFVLCLTLVVPLISLFESLKQIFAKMQEREGLLRHSFVILITYLLLNILFATVFRFIDLNSTTAFSKKLDGFWEALYFSIITMATVGYGDIAPTNIFTKTFVSLEVLMGLTLLTIVLSSTISISLEKKISRISSHDEEKN